MPYVKKVEVHPRRGHESPEGVEIQLYSFFNLSGRYGWVVSATPWPLYSQYPLYRRPGGPQGRSGQVRKFSSTTGIRSADRSARSESLYRLSYPGPKKTVKCPICAVRRADVVRAAVVWFVLTRVAKRVYVQDYIDSLLTEWNRKAHFK